MEGEDGEGGGGRRNSMNKGNSRAASSSTNKLTFTFSCPGQMLKEEKAVELDILASSILTLIFSFCSFDLFCHIPSTIKIKASSSSQALQSK